MVPLTSELKRTAGVFAETAWAGAVYYLLLYMLASHVSVFSSSVFRFVFAALFYLSCIQSH